MDAYGEEFFGPVGTVYRVSSEDEAVELANDTGYGLGSYVFTTDAEQASASPTRSRPEWSTSTSCSPTRPNCRSAA